MFESLSRISFDVSGHPVCSWHLPEEPAVRLSLLAPLLLASVALAQPPAAPAPRPINPYARGQAMLDAYLKDQVKRIEADCLNDLATKEAWEAKRPELRKQFLDMMGLHPLPPRTDLKATVTGTT